MEIFTEEELKKPIALTINELFIAMQILDRAANKNGVMPTEYENVAGWRNTLSEAIKASIGVTYDERIATVMEKQQESNEPDTKEGV